MSSRRRREPGAAGRSVVGCLAGVIAALGACAFDENRGLRSCSIDDPCDGDLVCRSGYCVPDQNAERAPEPRDGGAEPRADAAADATPQDLAPDSAPDLPPDGPPNIVIVAPTPNESLPASGEYTFKATVLQPGSGVLFRWRYDDGTCGGTTCRNPCQTPGPVPPTSSMLYEKIVRVAGAGAGELCAGVPLADHHRGAWAFEVQVGLEKTSVPFSVP